MVPTSLGPVIVPSPLVLATSIIDAAALSFLGVGLQPPMAEWGSMVRDNAVLINSGDITPLIPASAIALLTVGVNFVADWLLSKSSGLSNED